MTGSFLSEHDTYSSGRMRDQNVLCEKNRDNNYKEKNKQNNVYVRVFLVFILRVYVLQVHVLQVSVLHGRVLQVQSACYQSIPVLVFQYSTWVTAKVESDLLIKYMITDRIGRREVLLPIYHDYYTFRGF